MLPSDLFAFFEQAYIRPSDHSFFYYVSSLHGPDGLFYGANFLNSVWVVMKGINLLCYMQ
jgi:hypothetical protein